MAYQKTTAGAARAGAQAAVVADLGALTSAAAASTPTKTEFDKVVVDLAAARTKLNALLAALRSAGLLASS